MTKSKASLKTLKFGMLLVAFCVLSFNLQAQSLVGTEWKCDVSNTYIGYSMCSYLFKSANEVDFTIEVGNQSHTYNYMYAYKHPNITIYSDNNTTVNLYVSGNTFTDGSKNKYVRQKKTYEDLMKEVREYKKSRPMSF